MFWTPGVRNRAGEEEEPGIRKMYPANFWEGVRGLWGEKGEGGKGKVTSDETTSGYDFASVELEDVRHPFFGGGALGG